MRFSEKGGLILTTEGEETTGSGLTMSSDEEELPDKRSRSSGRWKREKQKLEVEDRSQSSVTGRFCHRTPETVLRKKPPMRQVEKYRSQSSSVAGFRYGAAESLPGSGNKLPTRQGEKSRSQSSAVAGGRYGTAESLPGSVNKLSTRQGEESKSQSSPVSVSRHGTPADSSLAGNSPPFTPATGREISLRRPMTLESVHESISMLRREIFAQFEDLKSRMTPAAASVEFVNIESCTSLEELDHLGKALERSILLNFLTQKGVKNVHEGMDLLIDKRLAATLTLTSKRENQAGDSKVGSLEQSGILEAVIPSFALHLKTSEDVVRKRIRWWLSRRAQEFRKKNMSETPASDEKNNLSGDSEDDDGKENEGHMEFELPLSEELPELPLSEREDPEEENEDLSYLGSEFARRIVKRD